MPIKRVAVFDLGSLRITQAVAINPDHLQKLATWHCHVLCRCFGNKFRDAEIQDNGGFCDLCRDDAGYMLVMCPFIDMEHDEDWGLSR